MTKLMAPILSFTAEEIWRTLRPQLGEGGHKSVHLAMFPETNPEWADKKLAQRWEYLLSVRTVVQAALERKAQ